MSKPHLAAPSHHNTRPVSLHEVARQGDLVVYARFFNILTLKSMIRKKLVQLFWRVYDYPMKEYANAIIIAGVMYLVTLVSEHHGYEAGALAAILAISSGLLILGLQKLDLAIAAWQKGRAEAAKPTYEQAMQAFAALDRDAILVLQGMAQHSGTKWMDGTAYFTGRCTAGNAETLDTLYSRGFIDMRGGYSDAIIRITPRTYALMQAGAMV